MAKVTAKLVTAALARLDDISTVPAQNVFMSLMDMALRGEAWAGQAEMAKRRSMGEERLKTALEHLESYGLLSLPLDPADRRSRLPVLDIGLIRAWLAGTHELHCVPRSSHVNSPENAGQITPQNAGYFKAERPENAGYPRARVNSSSSSPANTANPPASSHEAHELYTAMVSAVRKALPMLPPGAREAVWDWVGIYSLQLVQDACRVTARKGGRSLDYIDSVLRSMHVAMVLPDDGDGENA